VYSLETTPAEQMERLTLDIMQTERSLTEIVATIRIRSGFPFAESGESLVYLSYHMREYDYVTSISFSKFIRHPVGQEVRIRNICK